jgi:hypothetical protein
MVKRVAGTPLVPKVKAAAIDVVRHREEFTGAAIEVRGLVERLVGGMEYLRGLPANSPNRPRGEALWTRLTIRLHVALRSAYAHWALLKIALPLHEAFAIWDAELPTAAMEAIGIGDLMDYWRERTASPEWLTHEEAALITKHSWPPRFDRDALDAGLVEMLDSVPFD